MLTLERASPWKSIQHFHIHDCFRYNFLCYPIVSPFIAEKQYAALLLATELVKYNYHLLSSNLLKKV